MTMHDTASRLVSDRFSAQFLRLSLVKIRAGLLLASATILLVSYMLFLALFSDKVLESVYYVVWGIATFTAYFCDVVFLALILFDGDELAVAPGDLMNQIGNSDGSDEWFYRQIEGWIQLNDKRIARVFHEMRVAGIVFILAMLMHVFMLSLLMY